MTQLVVQLVAVLIAAGLLLAPALTSAATLNLAWNDCGAAGAVNKTFACSTNSGVDIIVGSVVAPSGIDSLVGIRATLDVWTSPDSAATALSDWWQCGAGGCRSACITANFGFTSGPYTCIDPWVF